MRVPGLKTMVVAAAALLPGCETLPVATFDQPKVSSVGAEAQHDMLFRPGTAEPLPGEAERTNAFLRGLVLRPQDDVILTFGTTGSDALDARRIAAARKFVAAAPARLRIVGPLGFSRAPERPDVVLVQAIRYDRVTVECPGDDRMSGPFDLPSNVPPSGCDNAVNRAAMTAEKRDLSAPGQLRGSDATTSILAVERYRRGEVTVAPLEVDPSN